MRKFRIGRRPWTVTSGNVGSRMEHMERMERAERMEPAECCENGERGSFVRNNYYPGKLLRAGDFVREQRYGNAKLEFVNRKLHGSGIIEGLEVGTEDGSTLCITAGSAIDYRGRILLVPEDVKVDVNSLDGRKKGEDREFVLGIRYEERQVERERSPLDETGGSEKGRILETYGLNAYSVEEWERLKAGDDVANLLAEERTLYQDALLKLSLRFPMVVPADSIFKVRMEAKVLGEGRVSVGWRGTLKLQGAFFLSSGKSLQEWEQRQTLVSGSLCQEWEICTEEYRIQSVAMELSRLEVFLQGAEPVDAGACQTYIETVAAYEDSARRYLQKRKGRKREADWVPLARLRSVAVEGSERVFRLVEEPRLRRYVVQTEETTAIRRALEENGILDVRWRGLLRRFPSRPEPVPEPILPAPGQPEPPQPEPTPRKEEEKQVHRGMTVIPIPRRYRRGDTLFSEEIAHGFPGEEVFLWLDRMYEENNYAYWERDKTRYAAVHGADELFADGWDSGWEVQKQAVRQDIEAGTFQIALVLARGRRKNRSKEVAVSWTAVRLPQPTKSS